MWSDSDNEDERDECDRVESPPGSQHVTSPECPVEASSSVLVRWLLAFFLLLQAQFHLADRVLNLIFVFLKTFFVVLGRLCAPCAVIGVKLPASLCKAQKTYKFHNVGFHKFPVCKRCGGVEI